MSFYDTFFRSSINEREKKNYLSSVKSWIKTFSLFKEPVAEKYPAIKHHYLTVIAYPKCLNDIRSSLTTNEYSHRGHYWRDVFLIISNSRQYNELNRSIMSETRSFEANVIRELRSTLGEHGIPTDTNKARRWLNEWMPPGHDPARIQDLQELDIEEAREPPLKKKQRSTADRDVTMSACSGSDKSKQPTTMPTTSKPLDPPATRTLLSRLASIQSGVAHLALKGRGGTVASRRRGMRALAAALTAAGVTVEQVAQGDIDIDISTLPDAQMRGVLAALEGALFSGDSRVVPS
eukprot:gnl/Dysnectes_brevis/4780_a6588_471.p1 GENE.gnl/Dysnectes_brevis/4780_a6588_471~~gnl/Dysnectes_brevis/4780_a6588_471.p1  ORF type:complete len:292 (+),score=53.10 gnl/Dysnectes_brevis/4780_a6588_471:61-936(+)